MSKVNIFNVGAGDSFVDVLAEKFIKEYEQHPEELAQVLFLLPNRRACQSLSDAFVRRRGMTPTILPQILPIADVEEDEIFLTGNHKLLTELPPEIDPVERLMIFTRLIMQKPADLGLENLSLSQAYVLAENLAALIDLSYNENLDFARIVEIVPEEYAAHWQQTLRLLSIITEYWPQILRERGVVDAVQRRNQLLKAELKIWQQSKPQQKIVVAGTTAAFPLLKELVKTVINLPNGEVYFYGLDKYLEDDAWEKIDENHPQFELKELLEYLQLNRSSVANLNPCPFTPRERLVSEVMRPASTSAEWRNLAAHPFSEEAFSGLQLINCDDVRQEAEAIALIIRHTLETPEKVAALVTSDRNLSRRVVAELKKWNIVADDSAGQPLSSTPLGIYLRLISEAVKGEFSEVRLLSLLKHPFVSAGKKHSEFKRLVYHLDLAFRQGKEFPEHLAELLKKVQEILQPLQDLYHLPRVDFAQILTTHIQVAERLADTDVKSGEKIIWKNDDGVGAAKLISSLLPQAAILGSIPSNDYSPLLEQMMLSQNIRVRYGMHPRVKILGTIEARLSQYDVIIIGEVNEGTWPKSPAADLWMSRPMKKDFGLPLPERSIGVMASDFAHLLNAPQVYLTRAERSDGTPTDKSRWWLRLETVLAANFGEDKESVAKLYNYKYSLWAKYLERAAEVKRIYPPRPCPKIERRPRKLSATNVDKLRRDPYTIYAKYILGLRPLGDLDKNTESCDYGNIVHKILEDFCQKYNTDVYPEDAREQLLSMGKKAFAEHGFSEDVLAFRLPQYAKTVDWIVDKEKSHRRGIKKIHTEIEGQVVLKAPAGDFVITDKADRVEELKNGEINIIDYKTGNVPSRNEVLSCWAPQLPIGGIIAQKGGFPGIKAASVASLRYWKPQKDEMCIQDKAADCIDKAYEFLQELVAIFDDENMPYLPRPRPKFGLDYWDYEHLARFREWNTQEEMGE